MIPFLGIREFPPGSFRKATLSRKNLDFLRVLTLGQSVFDPGVTGSKHMGDTSTRLVRFPTLVVPEQAGHSVLRWSQGGISSTSTVVESF